MGCGPLGLIHFADQASERIRVDPLLLQYNEKLPLEGRQLSICAIAESLPLASKSADLAICFNALDHMRDPEAALDELARVLRPGGTALLMIHTFPGWLWPFFRLDRMHPHHYTEQSFLSLVRSRFEIKQSETVRRHFDGNKLSPGNWKYLAGSLVVSSTYIRATAFACLTQPQTQRVESCAGR